jgi:hypothetical protein
MASDYGRSFPARLPWPVLTPPPAHFCAWVYGIQGELERFFSTSSATFWNDHLWLVCPSIACHAFHDPDWSRCRPEPFNSTLVFQDALWVACAHATCSRMHSCRLSRHLSDHTTKKACKFTGYLCCHPPILSTGTLLATHHYWRLHGVPPRLGILSFRTVFYITSYVVLSDLDVPFASPA